VSASQNGAKPECGIETAVQRAYHTQDGSCQNGAKPECGIETKPLLPDSGECLSVRMALSPNVGLKLLEDYIGLGYQDMSEWR